MRDIHEILHKYWGYDEFRPLQENIIRSVLDGKDTLALMPTGGGKSLTYQIPTLAMDGLCIVVTPLIALMRDQVGQLKSRGIKAAMIYSGMTSKEIDIVLTNAVFEQYKFLYVAPERLCTELFRAKVIEMKICLLAVDEAHCISQWGYDFRPSYLRIAELRTLLPNIPVLAVTATATPAVAEDIQHQLSFGKQNVIKAKFDRPNLSYIVRKVEDKLNYILKIQRKANGSGLIYVRNRKKTVEVANFLKKNGISADFYHAGLDDEIRTMKQTEWTLGKTEVMVATNAFGMGIDKADVRYVIHIDLPDSPEAYFQEAGRAGRDNKQSWAVLLYNDSDKIAMSKRENDQFPDIDYLKQVYDNLGVFLQVPYGECENMSIPFDFGLFCQRFKLSSVKAYNALKIIEKEGFIQWNEDTSSPTRMMFNVSRNDLYNFQVRNEDLDEFIKLVLRSYTGLFTEYTAINEQVLATRSHVAVEKVYEWMKLLYSYQIIKYIPHQDLPLITYLMARIPISSFWIPQSHLKFSRERYVERASKMLEYATTDKCRSKVLLTYFGQKEVKPCGHCDVCLSKNNKSGLTNYEFYTICDKIMLQLKQQPCNTQALTNNIDHEESRVLYVIRWLLDEGKIKSDDMGRLDIFS